jgi:hypothetical protein
VERDEYVTPEEVSMKVDDTGGLDSEAEDRERYLGAAEGQSRFPPRYPDHQYRLPSSKPLPELVVWIARRKSGLSFCRTKVSLTIRLTPCLSGEISGCTLPIKRPKDHKGEKVDNSKVFEKLIGALEKGDMVCPSVGGETASIWGRS